MSMTGGLPADKIMTACNKFVDAYREVIAAERAEEREACAKLADSHRIIGKKSGSPCDESNDGDCAAGCIAAAIRERGKP